MKAVLIVLTAVVSLSLATFGQDPVEPPKAINNPDPEYPAEAATLGYGGTVIVLVSVNKKGKVSIKNAFGPAAPCSNLVDRRIQKIRNAVIEAAKQASFEPPLKDGKPVEVEMSISYRFDKSGRPWRERAPIGNVIEGGVLQGRVKHMAKPEYPAGARAGRVAGAVPVGVLVDVDGRIIAAGAIGGHPLLRHSAENAVCASSVEPVSLSGVPVQVTGIITYQFLP